jgi:hypothetical protein
MVIMTRQFKRTGLEKARRIIGRRGFELSEAEWLMIAPHNMLAQLFASCNLFSEMDVVEALVLNMLFRARQFGFTPAHGDQEDGYMYLIDAELNGWAWLI